VSRLPLTPAKRTQTSQGETLELYGKEEYATDRLREIEHLLDGLSVAELCIGQQFFGHLRA
jgi:hypothetical protein